jgi:hypothetical protein
MGKRAAQTEHAVRPDLAVVELREGVPEVGAFVGLGVVRFDGGYGGQGAVDEGGGYAGLVTLSSEEWGGEDVGEGLDDDEERDGGE